MRTPALPPLRAGYAASDITPSPGITLSGFAARRNQPSTGIHDPLTVHALALEQGEQEVLILSFDLLAIGEPLAREMDRTLDAALGGGFPPQARVFACTHTHSAPAAIRLIGCGEKNEEYWRLLVAKTREAAERAVHSMREARMRYAVESLPGKNFNRRILLKDGRVVMAPHAPQFVRRTGPGWDNFLFLRLEEAASGAPIAGVIHWAAHPTTVCTEFVSGDYPAGLCRALQEREGIPFMFLQGASGDLNVELGAMTFDDTRRIIHAIMTDLPPLAWRAGPDEARVALASATVALRYQRPPARRELERMASTMQAISRGEPGDPAAIRVLENILNVPPGGTADPLMLRYIASILADWAKQPGQGSRGTSAAPGLAVKVMRLGPVAFAFVAAEVFVETAYALRGHFPRTPLAVVGYCAPLVGYLPTDEALKEGGYESDYAYRFYGHPAPFRRESEQQLVAVVRTLAEQLGFPDQD